MGRASAARDNVVQILIIALRRVPPPIVRRQMPRKGGAAKMSTRSQESNSGQDKRRDAEVVDAAATIFYERGYASATVQDVADALGMLKGSLYYYIDSKEDLLYRMMTEIHDGVDEGFESVLAVEGLSAAERLELYVRTEVAFNARNLKKVSVYYHEIDQLSAPRHKEIVGRRRAHEDQMTALIRQAQADGDADPNLDAKLLSNCLFATIIWMYRWYRPGRQVSVEDVADVCAHFVRYGLGVKPG
jgi:TetR/AcrR family transcriptional regulator, cholesterol catabolism regulator